MSLKIPPGFMWVTSEGPSTLKMFFRASDVTFVFDRSDKKGLQIFKTIIERESTNEEKIHCTETIEVVLERMNEALEAERKFKYPNQLPPS